MIPKSKYHHYDEDWVEAAPAPMGAAAEDGYCENEGKVSAAAANQTQVQAAVPAMDEDW